MAVTHLFSLWCCWTVCPTLDVVPIAGTLLCIQAVEGDKLSWAWDGPPKFKCSWCLLVQDGRCYGWIAFSVNSYVEILIPSPLGCKAYLEIMLKKKKKNVVADVVKLNEIILDCTDIPGVLIEMENLDTGTPIQGEHVNMKAEIKVMLPQAKEIWRLPANHQKSGERHGTDFSLQPWEGTSLKILQSQTSSFQLPEPWDNLLFKTLILRSLLW